MKETKQIKENIDYLFSKINWGDSALDAKAITIMNTLKKDIDEAVYNSGVVIFENVKDYEHESGHSIYHDERSSIEFADIHFGRMVS